MPESARSKNNIPLEPLIPADAVSLDSILCTEELRRRPSRRPDYEKENRALVALASALADSPRTILQTLAETILDVTQSDSSGVSLLTTDGKRFYWPAIAGVWKPHIGGGTPRDFGPCGEVLDRNIPLLFRHIERRYTYFLPVTPLVEECLLIPFYVGGKAVGTIWAIMHDDRRKFDVEDERLMSALGKFASSAYQTLASIDDLKFQIVQRENAETALRDLTNTLETRVRARTEELEEEIAERKRAEEELRRSEAYLAEAQRLSLTGSFGWRVVMGELVWSAETFCIMGVDQATKPTLELVLKRVHPEDVNLVQQTIDHATRDGTDFDFEHRLLMPDGLVKHVHVVARAVKAGSGVVEFVGAVMDITERKRAQEATRAATARFERILDIAEDAIISVDSNQRIVLFNQGAEKVFGYVADNILGQPLDNLLPQRFAPAHREHIETFAKASEVSRLMGQRREVFGRRKDGCEFPAEASISKLHLNGEVVFTVILRDITERKRAQSRLNTQYAITRILSESASIDEAVPRIVQVICGCLGWKVGEIWRVDGGTKLLTFVKAWHLPSGDFAEFASASLRFTFPPGVGLPGRVCEDRKPVWIRNLAEDSNFLRISLATKADLHCGFGFPILLGEETLGAMVFFSREVREPDQDVLEMMANIGSQIGQFIERRRAEEDLRRSETYLAEAQRLSLTGSFGWNVVSGEVCWSEETFRIFEYDQATKPTVAMMLERTHPEDTAIVRQTIDRACRRRKDFDLEHRLLMPDGSVKYVHVVGCPVGEPSGNLDFVGAVKDITVRKLAFQEIQKLKDQLHKENIALREEVDKASMFEEIVGASSALRGVLSSVTKVAPTDSTVLITGETGTGKELIARAIHKRSRRSARAFVSVNCAAIPMSLIASELFGHEKGAFTGALQRRLGRFELAEGGTIFLDEIGDLPAETQNTLLRVLQEHEFERVGGTAMIRADVRVIAATNRDLKAAMITGAFHSDLFYRLNVFPIEMPPLRARREDIPMLVEYFIDRYASKAGKKIRGINQKSLALLQFYPWPGNIRELQNVIERAVIVCETETLMIDENWLSQEAVKTQPPIGTLSEELVAREKERIETALAQARGRVSGSAGAAAKLGIPRSTLDSKIRSLKINKHRFKSA